jgi:uncharacterized protein YbaP (TraB family)
MPAIWKVQGAHETVYLFGTVHGMKPEVHWQTAKVEDAFKQSDVLYLEIAKLDDLEAMKPLVMELGMDPAHPLSTKISAEDKGRLDAAVRGMGMPGEEMFEPMQPWMAYLTLQVLPMIKAGLNPQSGIDLALSQDAKASAKPVMGFETVGEQAHFFADFPQEQQVNLLHQELDELPKAPEQMNAMVADWASGNVDAIAAMENGEFQTKYPALYAKLVVERNKKWADQLATLLNSDKAGVAFVAVGAAHLAGPDSVQHDLEAKGFKVVRE